MLDDRGSQRFCFYDIASTLLPSPFSLLAFSLRNHQRAQKPPSKLGVDCSLWKLLSSLELLLAWCLLIEYWSIKTQVFVFCQRNADVLIFWDFFVLAGFLVFEMGLHRTFHKFKFHRS